LTPDKYQATQTQNSYLPNKCGKWYFPARDGWCSGKQLKGGKDAFRMCYR